MIPLAISVPPIQICGIITLVTDFRSIYTLRLALLGGAPGETPVSPLPSAESATPGAASVILYKTSYGDFNSEYQQERGSRNHRQLRTRTRLEPVPAIWISGSRTEPARPAASATASRPAV